MHGLPGTTVLKTLPYYIIAFPRNFQGGVQITDRTILLEVDLGLRGFLSTAVELIVPGLVVPSLVNQDLGAPGFTVPGMVAPRLAVQAWLSQVKLLQFWLLHIERFPEAFTRHPW